MANLLNILARAMARAIVRARGATAALARVAGEALALDGRVGRVRGWGEVLVMVASWRLGQGSKMCRWRGKKSGSAGGQAASGELDLQGGGCRVWWVILAGRAVVSRSCSHLAGIAVTDAFTGALPVAVVVAVLVGVIHPSNLESKSDAVW